ncbi:MAG: hypothetical protein KJO21_07055 [Verrucomicrobiae bacterium]|nr:hypothetical protein [Verrucomicrobiae bacterium]NNJ43875.1 hypothetical protein [Akkermansiaceae bacterium]
MLSITSFKKKFPSRWMLTLFGCCFCSSLKATPAADFTYYPAAIVPEYSESFVVKNSWGDPFSVKTQNLLGLASDYKIVFPIINFTGQLPIAFTGNTPTFSDTHINNVVDNPSRNWTHTDTSVTEEGIRLYAMRTQGDIYGEIPGSIDLETDIPRWDWLELAKYWTIGANEVKRGVILKRRIETVGVVQTTKYRRDAEYIDPHNNTPDYDTTGPSYRMTSQETIEHRSVIAGMDTVPYLFPGSELIGPIFYTRPYSAIVRITELKYLSLRRETFVKENGEETSIAVTTDLPDTVTRIDWIVKGHGVVRSLPIEGQYLDFLMDLHIFNDGSNVVGATSLANLGLTQNPSSEVLRSSGGHLANPSDTFLVQTNQRLEMWPWPVPYAFLPEAHPTWYMDADGDGYGDPDVNLISDVRPDGYVSKSGDCDDTDASLNPETKWYADTDGDGYGNALDSKTQCEQPVGYVMNDDDSDDLDPLVHTDPGLFGGNAEHPDDPATPPVSTPSTVVTSRTSKYSGFLSSADGSEIRGYFKSIKVSKSGKLTAKMYFGNVSYSLKGLFDQNGQYSGLITPKKGSPATVNLQLVSTSEGGDKIEGTVVVGNQTSNVGAVKSGATGSQAGGYTILILGDEGETTAPQGHGYALMTVTSVGTVKMKGLLGDGSKWTAKCYVTPDGEMPLYAALYRKAGSLGGLVRFRNVDGVSDCDGAVHWHKPGTTRILPYSGGFDLQRNLIGSRFNYTGSRLIAGALNSVPNVAAHVGEGSGDPSRSWDLEWTSANKIYYAGPEKVKVSVKTKTGQIKGYITSNGTKQKVEGVVFQKQELGAGFVSIKRGNTRRLVMVPKE